MNELGFILCCVAFISIICLLGFAAYQKDKESYASWGRDMRSDIEKKRDLVDSEQYQLGFDAGINNSKPSGVRSEAYMDGYSEGLKRTDSQYDK